MTETGHPRVGSVSDIRASVIRTLIRHSNFVIRISGGTARLDDPCLDRLRGPPPTPWSRIPHVLPPPVPSILPPRRRRRHGPAAAGRHVPGPPRRQRRRRRVAHPAKAADGGHLHQL